MKWMPHLNSYVFNVYLSKCERDVYTSTRYAINCIVNLTDNWRYIVMRSVVEYK